MGAEAYPVAAGLGNPVIAGIVGEYHFPGCLRIEAASLHGVNMEESVDQPPPGTGVEAGMQVIEYECIAFTGNGVCPRCLVAGYRQAGSPCRLCEPKGQCNNQQNS